MAEVFLIRFLFFAKPTLLYGIDQTKIGNRHPKVFLQLEANTTVLDVEGVWLEEEHSA